MKPIFKTCRFIYQYCESVTERPIATNNKSNASETHFETKSWCPVDLCLQEIGHSLVEKVSYFFVESNVCFEINFHRIFPHMRECCLECYLLCIRLFWSVLFGFGLRIRRISLNQQRNLHK